MHHSSLFRQASRVLAKSSRSTKWICEPCRRQFVRSAVLQSRPQSVPITRSEGGKPFYVTTPIFYVNAEPHVGHFYTMVLADVIKRYRLLLGEEALLLTGTDEHGLKIQRAAAKADVEPKQFCDKGAEVFKSLAARASLSYDYFLRTTDEDHKEAVQYAWQLLKEKDLIYSSKHVGWYSVSDETFYPASAVHLIIEAWSGRKHMASIETGKEVEWTEEQNYHFRLSVFKEPLLKFYADNPTWIKPSTRHADVVRWVEEGLEDLSISRPTSRLTWGIPVPEDPSQTIYVWLDALLNYATKAGYPWTPENASKGGWPADVQVIGKDIVRFHCMYWPAFLMALDLPLPKAILTHAHWTLGKEKMSKSTGNVVNPFFAMDRFGVDVMRYYLAREGSFKDDASYDNLHIIRRYNHDLKGQLGNLASRIIRGKKWSIRDAVKAAETEDWVELRLVDSKSVHNGQWKMLEDREGDVRKLMADYDVHAALNSIIDTIYQTNVYFAHQAPWHMAATIDKAAHEDLNIVIFLASEGLRITGILLQPFMPAKAALLLDMLGVAADRRTADFAAPGRDYTYGTSEVALGKGELGTLFPPLISGD